jgi:hypothetical protein
MHHILGGVYYNIRLKTPKNGHQKKIYPFWYFNQMVVNV